MQHVRLFLCGDVMTGRGIDQILPHPCAPQLHERYCRSAHDYVSLAEQANGPLPPHADATYPWGDALAVLDSRQPHARIINLETAVTTSDDHCAGKEVLYRMHPDNVGCIASARIDCCVLANNHVLDWGRAGLRETLATLHRAGIRTSGAGADETDAAAPATLGLADNRTLRIYAYAAESSGVPLSWAATPHQGGLNFLPDISMKHADEIGQRMAAERCAGDIVVISLHWGSNWGFEVGDDERAFAHRLIDSGGADLVYGHSSHHVRGMEVHRGRLVLYGCGDFLNDYEGIRGHERFRPDLALMYFPVVDADTGVLLEMSAVPMQIHHLRLRHAPAEGASWLRTTLAHENGKFGGQVIQDDTGALLLQW